MKMVVKQLARLRHDNTLFFIKFDSFDNQSAVIVIRNYIIMVSQKSSQFLIKLIYNLISLRIVF